MDTQAFASSSAIFTPTSSPSKRLISRSSDISPSKRSALGGPSKPSNPLFFKSSTQVNQITVVYPFQFAKDQAVELLRNVNSHDEDLYRITNRVDEMARTKCCTEARERAQEDLQAQLKILRHELQAEIKGVKQDLQAEIKGVRQDLQAEIKDVKDIVQEGFKTIIDEIDKLNQRKTD